MINVLLKKKSSNQWLVKQDRQGGAMEEFELETWDQGWCFKAKNSTNTNLIRL